jgi:hypothetical protein
VNARVELAAHETAHGRFVNRSVFSERRDERRAHTGKWSSHNSSLRLMSLRMYELTDLGCGIANPDS